MITTDSQLASLGGEVIGYADRAPCPAGSYGLDGTPSFPRDCAGTGSWPGSTWQLTGLPNNPPAPYTPFTGARLWIASGSMQAGSGNTTYSIQSTIDITRGESGAPLYTQDLGSRQAVGTLSGDEDSYNIYSRWTSETYNFMHTYAPSFPPN